jgi:hypothetical protein
MDFKDTRSPLEETLRGLGGAWFGNCITPAPDTPRSAAIFFSGELPAITGVNRRSKWPGPFLPNRYGESIFGQITEGTLTIIDESLKHSQIFFPKAVQGAADFYPTLDEFVEKADSKTNKDEIIFIVSKTYHKVVDSRYAHRSSHSKAVSLIDSELHDAIEQLSIGPGDKMILFSDHGCKLTSDEFDSLSRLNRDRSQVAFFATDFSAPDEFSIVENLLSMVNLHQLTRAFISDPNIDVTSLVRLVETEEIG